MKHLIHTFLLLTFFAFTANLVQKIVWAEKMETVAENDDESDDSDESDDEEEKEWFLELPSVVEHQSEINDELIAQTFPELRADLPSPITSQLKSPPECMC